MLDRNLWTEPAIWTTKRLSDTPPAPQGTIEIRRAHLALSGIPFLGHLLPHLPPKNHLLSAGCCALLSTGTILLRVIMTFALSTWASLLISKPSTEYKRLATQSALRLRDRPKCHSVIPSSPVPRSPECAQAFRHDIAHPIDHFVATTVFSRISEDIQKRRSAAWKTMHVDVQAREPSHESPLVGGSVT